MAEGHHTLELVWKGLNILLFLAIVYYFGRKPVGEAFRSFFLKLTENLEESEKELRRAKEALEKAKFEYEDAKRRHAEQIKLAEQTAQQIKEEEIKKIDEVVRRIKEKARESIELETKKAKEELLKYGIQKAKELAIKRLMEDFQNPDVQRRYVEKTIKKMEASQ
ncbi:ATP synthase F0 subunit B [Thermocrinis jamiesonii]|uniref:F0F1 ATP synthase subunit B family protein n=1 Tax=Thermocrinis jamiesonii TaxID=1302351 RepID=UPI000496C8B0|nr:ATP synthase F0 subunit B [Thermocrinis jamiesonii]